MKARFLKASLKAKEETPMSRIIVLTGARQTGKTTLAKHCFSDHKYLSIEDPIMRLQYKKLTASQWKELFPRAILDEVQKEPQLIESVKSAYDQFSDVRYVLLGSSQLLLLKKIKESLAGRCIIKELLPLTLPEILTKSWDETIKPSFFQQFIQDKKLPDLLPSFQLYPDFAIRKTAFDYYMNYGGYPALTDENINDSDRYEWLSNYIQTYLERDIRDLAEIRLLEPFIKIQQLSANLTGQLINFSNLANDADINSKTARKFINYLEISYQAILLQPWFGNKIKRLVKTPKLHYLDPGVLKGILNKKGALNGHEFESAVIAEIYKQFKAIEGKGNFYHLRTHSGIEIDFLIELEEGYLAFEIKLTNKISNKDSRHLVKLDKILDKPLIHSFIISNDMMVQKINEHITALPASMFLT